MASFFHGRFGHPARSIAAFLLALLLALPAAARPAADMPGRTDASAAPAGAARAAATATPAEDAWAIEDIAASRIEHVPVAGLPDRPAYAADPLNLFVVIEDGARHASILDGERLRPLARLASRSTFHGAPHFSPDGRFVHFASRDGWIVRYDLWSLRQVAEARVGLQAADFAVSSDGRYLLAGNIAPRTLVVLDARDLSPVKVIAVASRDGQTSRVAAVHDAAPRKSFVVALEDVPELWEVSYDDRVEPIYEGLVHDFRMGEGIPIPGKLNPRRTRLEKALHDVGFAPGRWELLGSPRDGGPTRVINLDIRRAITSLPLPGQPRPERGARWLRDGRAVLAVPNRGEGTISMVDTVDWKEVARIRTPGAGAFVAVHESAPHAWADAAASTRGDTLVVIDKRTLETVATLRAGAGRKATGAAFTRDGTRVLAALQGDDGGALVAYDARTRAEIARIPMRQPQGIHNVSGELARSGPAR